MVFLSTYFRLCSAHKPVFVLAFSMGAAASYCMARAPHYMSMITIALTSDPEGDTEVLASYVYALIGFQVLSSFFAAMRGLLFTYIQSVVHRDASRLAVNVLMRKTVSEFEEEQEMSDLMTIYMDRFVNDTTLNGNVAVRTCISTTMVLGAMVSVSPVLTVLSLTSLLVRLGVFKAYEKFSEKNSKAFNEKEKALHSLVREYTDHVLIAKMFCKDGWYVEEHASRYDSYFRLKQKNAYVYGAWVLVSSLMDRVTLMATLLVAMSSYLKLPDARSTDIIYFINYQQVLGAQIDEIFTAVRTSVTQHATFTKVNDLLQQRNDDVHVHDQVGIRDLLEARSNPEPRDTKSFHISFADVVFAYPKRPEAKVIRGLTFDLPQGNNCVIRGPSGSGKSTIIKLIAGVYGSQAGRVTLGGYDPTRYDIDSVRNYMTFVPQEPVLFNRSIADNIMMSQTSTKEMDVAISDACKMVGIHDFITSLPDGYDTTCGSPGLQCLSGGQKQRIALARAIVRSPKTRILCLDEPTSALDRVSRSEVNSVIQGFMDDVDVTVIMVTHDDWLDMKFDVTVDLTPTF